MNRTLTVAIVLVAAISLVGCLGTSGSAGTDPGASSTLSPTSATVTETALVASGVGTPTPVESQVDVPTCPTYPATPTEETVAEFATAFEEASVIRDVVRDTERVTAVSVDVQSESVDVSETDDGWTVHFDVVGPAYSYSPEQGTADADHVDPPLYTASYFVNESVVYREPAVQAVDARRNGSVVQCSTGS